MFKNYKRLGHAEAKPYNVHEALSDRVSISAADKEAGSPKPGDWIARNPDNHEDQWLIAKDYWDKNFGPIVQDFGWALEQLKAGHKVARAGWNGKGMWLVLVGRTETVKTGLNTPYRNAGVLQTSIDSHIDMRTAQATMQPGWLASQADMLSEDWELVP